MGWEIRESIVSTAAASSGVIVRADPNRRVLIIGSNSANLYVGTKSPPAAGSFGLKLNNLIVPYLHLRYNLDGALVTCDWYYLDSSLADISVLELLWSK